jgi:hypothetical protein
MLCLVMAVSATAVHHIWKFLTSRGEQPGADWLNDFDLSRYSVLDNLFHPRDFEFLRSQPGYTPELSARLKADRLKIAEGYLSQLERDVRMLLTFANRAAAQSDSDHDQLSAFLLKQEAKFIWNLLSLRMQIALMRIGLLHQLSFDHVLESLRPLVLESRVLALPTA